LNDLRTATRQALQPAGLAETLDARYKIITAHVTLMRFKTPPRDLSRLAAALTAAHQRNFGVSVIKQLEFVVNDWYMSQDKVQLVATYPLRPKF
jgi:hypothetical protein